MTAVDHLEFHRKDVLTACHFCGVTFYKANLWLEKQNPIWRPAVTY